MKIKNKDIKHLLIFMFIVLILFVISTYRRRTIEEDGVYTIATIYNIEGARGGLKIHFRYFVKDQEYTGSYIDGEKKEEYYIGLRFIVKYLPKQPKCCYVEDIYIPYSIIEAPAEGWKEIPKEILEAHERGYIPKNTIYTFATITQIDPTHNKNTLMCIYTYDYLGVNYQGKVITSDLAHLKLNTKFFIQVNVSYPQKHILTPIPVPNSITDAPAFGWEEIPISSN